jgi:hypothetical protein
MVDRPKRVTARRVRPFYSRLFKAASLDSLLTLRAAITDGVSFDGKRYDTCVYGNLAKGAGHDFVDRTPEEVMESIRSFGRSIGIEIKADGRLDYVEQFCAHVGRGDSALTCSSASPLWHVEAWLNFALMEKGFNPFQNAVMVGEEAVGV